MKNFGLHHIVKTVPIVPDLAKNLPPVWEYRSPHYFREVFPGEAFYLKPKKLLVICSLDTMENGKTYLHISLSFANKIPDWDMVKMVKEKFIGKDKDAFIYFPIESEYINLMPYCLHLWSEE